MNREMLAATNIILNWEAEEATENSQEEEEDLAKASQLANWLANPADTCGATQLWKRQSKYSILHQFS